MENEERKARKMCDEIFSVIKKASIFLIGAQLILHLKPNGMYEKYLKFIVHLMALTLFMMLLLKLFGQTDEKAFSQSLAGYEEMMQEDMMQINYICDLSEEKRQEIYTREIKSKLNNIYGENPTEAPAPIETVEIEVKAHEGNP